MVGLLEMCIFLIGHMFWSTGYSGGILGSTSGDVFAVYL